MRSYFPFFISIRYVLAKKNEKFLSVISFIALIGNSLGIAALIIVTSVMNGFHLALIQNVIGINGEIKLTSINYNYEQVQKIKDNLSQHPFILSIDPVIYEKVLLLGKRNSVGAIIKSFDYESLLKKHKILDNIILGDLSNINLESVLILGKNLADQLEVTVGKNVRVVSSKYKASLMGSLPRIKIFTVGAIYETGIYDLDVFNILISPQNTRDFLGLTDNYYNNIEIFIDDLSNTQNYAKQINSSLKNLDQQIHVSTWQDHNQQLINALKLEKTSMVVILTIIIIIAAFNILSGLFIFVKDKTKDISILKKIGASNLQIMSIFLINGLIIAIFSMILGLFLGLIITYNINYILELLETVFSLRIFDFSLYYLTEIPYNVKAFDVLIILFTSLTLSVLASIYPSFKAAKLNPIKLSRYE
ncbi:MAG: FtsX-like permease family protein [Rickettsia sp.]|nr:FtsX-like permease family protein [Rickettsia sp.]